MVYIQSHYYVKKPYLVSMKMHMHFLYKDIEDKLSKV